MSNLYFPIYQKLEEEIVNLAYPIMFDDQQITVYSEQIISLLLRAVTEIEALIKHLCETNGFSISEKRGGTFLDGNGFEYLNKIYKLDRKIVYINNYNFHFGVERNYKITPFKKYKNVKHKYSNYEKEDEESFGWNFAYQSVKHDRANYYKLGTLQNLLRAMGALYLLHFYHNEPKFPNSKLFSVAIGHDYDFILQDDKTQSYFVNVNSEVYKDRDQYSQFGHWNAGAIFEKLGRQHNGIGGDFLNDFSDEDWKKLTQKDFQKYGEAS